jgi:hypothetical protein
MINLLPPEQIRELKEEENFKILLNIFFLISFFLFTFFLISLAIKFYLVGIFESQKILFEKGEKILDLEKENEIKKYNQILTEIDKFYKKKKFIFPEIENFFGKIPEGISLKEIEAKVDKEGKISFSVFGFSKTREDLLNLMGKLKESYQKVSFPPEIFLKETEIDFSVNFKTK